MMSAIPGGSQSDIESFEEYTWAGQTRVRASTMIEGGLAGRNIESIILCLY